MKLFPVRNSFTFPFLFVLGFAFSHVGGQTDYNALRNLMVKEQLKERGIHDKATLKAMALVPRHKFVPEDVRDRAYTDGALPIGEGQTISQPYIVAFMTQALNLGSSAKVLEIGTGSGYQAAVLSMIADSVYTMEILPDLGETARVKLKTLGYSNVRVRIGDGYHGWPEKAPFNAIIVTAGAEHIPRALMEQLAEGGRMVIPVGPHRGIRNLKLIRRRGDKYKTRDLMKVRFVPFTRGKQ